jgi:hypothetical protein
LSTTAVGADRQRGAQRFLARGDAAADRDDLGRAAGFPQPHRFLDGDFVERVHAHLDPSQVDAAAVGLDPDLDVVVDHALDRDQHLHAFTPFIEGWLESCQSGFEPESNDRSL